MVKNLVFVDSRVSNYPALIASLDANTSWVLLDPNQDGVLQMQAALAGYSGLDSIQIVSHGSPGTLYLGSLNLTTANLARYSSAFAVIGASLRESGDILLYGCSVGQGPIGSGFVTELARFTGADVAASTDVTGSPGLAGNWILERATGRIETAALQPANYAATLAIIDGTPGDNTLTGTALADTLTGFAGADTLQGGDGDDILVGGTGQDTAVYLGAYAAYSVAFGAMGGSAQVSGAEGSDTLSGVETLRFADATVKVSLGGMGLAGLRVNRTTTGEQINPSTTALADGGWLATWMSQGQDGSGWGIYAQRYDAAGAANGFEFRVNHTTSNAQGNPSVAALADGGWVVTWDSYGQDGSGQGVYAQRYDAEGLLRGAEFQVNKTTNEGQYNPSIAVLSDGGWVITWQSSGQDGMDSGIYAQRYDAAGLARGPEFQVNTYASWAQEHPAITALTDGGWLVTWQSYVQDGDRWGIFAQRYAENGAARGTEFQVNTSTSLSQELPSVKALDDGGWIVTWHNEFRDDTEGRIAARRYTADGSASGVEFRVDGETTNIALKQPYDPSVIALSTGGWVETWHAENYMGSGHDIYAQRYDNAGNATGGVVLDVTGDASSQLLTGDNGNDTLRGAAGDDTLRGGDGIDTAQYNGPRDHFQLTPILSGGWSIQDLWQSEGTDEITGIERLQFADKKIALDLQPEDHAGQALEFLGVLAPTLINAPSITGLLIDLIDRGTSLPGVFQLAIDTGLVNTIAGSNSNAAVAKMAYRNVIGAEADEPTIDLLVGFMDGRIADFNQAGFLTAIARLEINQDHIGLLGIQQTGIEYI